MRRVVSCAALVAALCLVWPGLPQARQTVWFNETFNTPTSDCEYGFGFFYGGTCTGGGTAGGESPYWSFAHVAGGDSDGSGAARLTKLAGADQYSMGWVVTTSVLGHSFTIGDDYYVRLRVRLDDSWRFTAATSGCFDGSGSIACAGNMQTKFFGMGDTGSPQSRVIMFLQSPQGNFGCMLGSSPSNPGVGTAPSDFGLSGANWLDAALVGKYGSFSVHTNTGAVADGCVGPVLTTYGNNPDFPASTTGTAPSTTSGWQHIQFYVKSSNTSDGEYKIWSNNNSFGTPTYEIDGFNLGVVNWDNGFVIGWQTTGPLAADASYKLGEIEIGNSFDATWFPGGGGATAPDAPTIGTATAGNTTCSIAFTPGSDGGSTITGYTAIRSPGGNTYTGGSSPIVATGLSNGTGYTFTVYATNAEGDSSPSASSNTCTPSAAAAVLPAGMRVPLRIRP